MYPVADGLLQATTYMAKAAREEGVKGLVNMSQATTLNVSTTLIYIVHLLTLLVLSYTESSSAVRAQRIGARKRSLTGLTLVPCTSIRITLWRTTLCSLVPLCKEKALLMFPTIPRRNT